MNLASAGNNINDFTYETGIDQDPSEGVNFTASDLINAPFALFAEHSMGNNNTAQGGGIEPGFFTYTSELANHNVIQNSIPFTFPGYDPSIDATYEVYA